MGWGTFLVGRALNPRPKAKLSHGLAGAAEQLVRATTDFEYEVLEEISRLKSEGKEVNIDEIRAKIKKFRKVRRKMGSALELAIVKRAQEKVLAGEIADYAVIEREILSERKLFPWGNVFYWIFFPESILFLRAYKYVLRLAKLKPKK